MMPQKNSQVRTVQVMPKTDVNVAICDQKRHKALQFKKNRFGGFT